MCALSDIGREKLLQIAKLALRRLKEIAILLLTRSPMRPPIGPICRAAPSEKVMVEGNAKKRDGFRRGLYLIMNKLTASVAG